MGRLLGLRDVLDVARVKANLAFVLTRSLSHGDTGASPVDPLARYRLKLEILVVPDQLAQFVVLHHRQLRKDILDGAAWLRRAKRALHSEGFPQFQGPWRLVDLRILCRQPGEPDSYARKPKFVFKVLVNVVVS